MAKHDGETIIKKYANRRLYNTGTSTYVTLDDLAQMVKRGEDFKVQDAKSSEDITHAVLTQIIVEQEAKTGNTLLPTAFLRQLISYYGDQMQMVVPTFLEHSMKTFSDQQSQMQEHMAKAFGDGSLARNITVAEAGRYFGIYALSGRATSFMATLSFSMTTYMSGSAHIGMASLILFLGSGFLLLLRVPERTES